MSDTSGPWSRKSVPRGGVQWGGTWGFRLYFVLRESHCCVANNVAGFTIDSPLKVAQYGIDSVISLVDDILLEKLRKMYSEKFEIPYYEITDKINDFRAKRITSYLNLINDQAIKKFEALKNVTENKTDEIKEYINMLPD